MSDLFGYQEGVLHFGSLNLKPFIAKKKTPFYLYNLSVVRQMVVCLQQSLQPYPVKIHYAMKANYHPLILQTLKQLGLGVDTVSLGEIKKALKVGFKPQDIILSGVGKTKEEIHFAITQKIKQINIESAQELMRVGQLAQQKKLKVAVALRMNPDVNAMTHPYITTGFRENKFGLAFNELPELLKIIKQYQEFLDLRGLTLHIGSQMLDLSALKEAIKKTKVLYFDLLRAGFNLKTLDIGGGVGIAYRPQDRAPQPQDLIPLIEEAVAGLPTGIEILIEPGRYLVADAGILITQVEYIKTNDFKNFAIVDTGMHHLLRPALYQAYHHIWPLIEPSSANQKIYDVVGPICESSDTLAKARLLPELHQGDYLVITQAGAYGEVMSSQYNLRPMSKAVVC